MITRNIPKRVLSLFSGCGGMDLGIEGGFEVLDASISNKVNPGWIVTKTRAGWAKLPKTGFKTIFANDIRPDAMIAWVNYFSKRGAIPEVYKLGSIVDLVRAARDNGDNIFPTDVDIVTGGFPCQDFSVAGKRLGFNSDKSHTGERINTEIEPNVDNRGNLYIWMREVIRITQPKMFIAENVKGLVNLNDVKDVIQKDFSSICENGYIVVNARVLHAGNYGVPQTRERVFFFGFLRSALRIEAIEALTSREIPPEYDPYPIPTHYIEENDDVLRRHRNLMPAVTVAQALGDLPEPGEEDSDLSHKSYSKARWMGSHCQGQTEVEWNGLGPTIRAEHHGNIEYRRLSLEHGGGLVDELNKGLPERRLSVRECARIQTFPDDYEFVIKGDKKNKGVSATDAYKLVGNAVPPLLVYHVAKRIENLWDRYFIGGQYDYSNQQETKFG